MTSYVRPIRPIIAAGRGAPPATDPLPGRNATRGNVAGVTLAAKVLTVSESVSRGTREDRSGEELAAALTRHGYRIVERRVVPDGVAPVASALRDLSSSFAGLLVTTGEGQGFSPTDLTPEATRSVIEREGPGNGRGHARRQPPRAPLAWCRGCYRSVSRAERSRDPPKGRSSPWTRSSTCFPMRSSSWPEVHPTSLRAGPTVAGMEEWKPERPVKGNNWHGSY